MRSWSDTLGDFATAIVQGKPAPTTLIARYENYTADIALDIYRNNYRGNLHDALAGAYPVIQQLVGADFFRFMAKKFSEVYPSRSGNLYYYGAQLGSFLTTFEPAQTLPYLADMAALEWACQVAYFADDVAPLEINVLASIAPENYADLRFYFHPVCAVLRSNFPVAAIWHAHQTNADQDFQLSLDSGKSIALVTRSENVVQVLELADDYADWLQALLNGALLGDAVENTMMNHANFDVSAALQKLVAQNILTDVKIGVRT